MKINKGKTLKIAIISILGLMILTACIIAVLYNKAVKDMESNPINTGIQVQNPPTNNSTPSTQIPSNGAPAYNGNGGSGIDWIDDILNP